MNTGEAQSTRSTRSFVDRKPTLMSKNVKREEHATTLEMCQIGQTEGGEGPKEEEKKQTQRTYLF